MTKVISINNNKGGVLKTTTALSIASIFAKKYHFKVLLIDFDAQSNLSTAFGINGEKLQDTLIKLLSDDSNEEDFVEILDKTIIKDVYLSAHDHVIEEQKQIKKLTNQINFIKSLKTISEKGQKKIEFLEQKISILKKQIQIHEIANEDGGRIDILPSNSGLAKIEHFALKNNVLVLSERLRRLIDFLRDEDFYDYIIIDSPPALNIIQSNILEVTDGIIIPLEMEYYSINGLKRMLGVIRKFQNETNPDLELLAIFPVKVNVRSKLHKDVYKILRLSLASQANERFFDALVPLEDGLPPSIQEATSIAYKSKPLMLTKDFENIKPSDRVTPAYLKLANLIVEDFE